MQHETLCGEHINVGYPRAGASLSTSHKPFTTWWGKLLPLQSLSHCLKYHCMARHTLLRGTAERCVGFLISVGFTLLTLCLSSTELRAIPESINFVNWASFGELISATHENLILCQF